MTTISNHPRLNPTKQRLIALFVRIILAVNLFISGVLLVTSVIYVLPLLTLTVFFIIALTLPVFLQTSLHPAFEVREDGLYVQPLVWRNELIEWNAISHLTAHPLLKPPPPSQIPLINKTPHDGLLIVCHKGMAAWHYQLIGMMTGQGRTPVFAFSNHTHQDYKQLRRELKRRLKVKDAK